MIPHSWITEFNIQIQHVSVWCYRIEFGSAPFSASLEPARSSEVHSLPPHAAIEVVGLNIMNTKTRFLSISVMLSAALFLTLPASQAGAEKVQSSSGLTMT